MKKRALYPFLAAVALSGALLSGCETMPNVGQMGNLASALGGGGGGGGSGMANGIQDVIGGASAAILASAGRLDGTSRSATM